MSYYISSYRLVLTSCLIVHKFFSDFFYTNQMIATIGGVDIKNINFLESMFLQYIDFNLSITDQEYDDYKMGLEQYFELPLKPEITEVKEQIN